MIYSVILQSAIDNYRIKLMCMDMCSLEFHESSIKYTAIKKELDIYFRSLT